MFMRKRLQFIILGQTSRVKGEGSLFWGKFCSKNFFFRVRRKEKTPNQYAEIINVYANESLTKKTRKIKGTKWILMDMCFKHANRQHTTRDKHQKQIIVLWSNSGYMWTDPPRPTLLLFSISPECFSGWHIWYFNQEVNIKATRLEAQETPDCFSKCKKQRYLQVH